MLELSDVKDRESVDQFETRKIDHMRVAMDPAVQAPGSGFDAYSFVHEALPEIDFSDVSISSEIFSGTSFSKKLASPFFISSMTAGHAGSASINETMAACAESQGWAMGVGSQRRELFDADAASEWKRIRTKCPGAVLYGNIGVSQLIHTDVDVIRRLADSLQASAMIVHLNALQESLQDEGTPQFRGGLASIATLVKALGIPVIVKETGCGISAVTATKLVDAGVHVIDVAGRGGTHWGRIEGVRAGEGADRKSQRAAILAGASVTLGDWGLSTVESLKQVARVTETSGTRVWASGGVRSGLDGAKALMLGASAIGVAQPIMAAALEGADALRLMMARFDYELKTILFCQGVTTLADLKLRGNLVPIEKVV